jgi:hypothetical protein
VTGSEDFTWRPRRLGYLVIGLILLYLAYTAIRNVRIDALGRAACDKNADPTVVDKLASYRGGRASERLFLVAGVAPSEENQIAAIRALVRRKDDFFVSRLSELLLPSEPLAIRKEIAGALNQTGCSLQCVRNVLYFEERMSNGSRPAEDVTSDPPGKLSSQEIQLQNSLDEVLKKDKPALLLVLGSVYGMASDFPSPFAIDVAERLDFKEACPLLMHTYLSNNDQVRASPEYANVVAAVQVLQCPGPHAAR